VGNAISENGNSASRRNWLASPGTISEISPVNGSCDFQVGSDVAVLRDPDDVKRNVPADVPGQYLPGVRLRPEVPALDALWVVYPRFTPCRNSERQA